MSTVQPAMQSGGFTSAQTNATGANWTAFPSKKCLRLVIFNTTGTDIEIAQDGDTSKTLTIPSSQPFELYGIWDAAQISVRRFDQSNTQVTVKARWEA